MYLWVLEQKIGYIGLPSSHQKWTEQTNPRLENCFNMSEEASFHSGLSSYQYCPSYRPWSEKSDLLSSYWFLRTFPVEKMMIFGSLPIRDVRHVFVGIRAIYYGIVPKSPFWDCCCRNDWLQHESHHRWWETENAINKGKLLQTFSPNPRPNRPT